MFEIPGRSPEVPPAWLISRLFKRLDPIEAVKPSSLH